MDPLRKAIGRRIEQASTQAGYASLADLARACNSNAVSRKNLYNWVSGERLPSHEAIVEIARKTNADPCFLYCLSDTPTHEKKFLNLRGCQDILFTERFFETLGESWEGVELVRHRNQYLLVNFSDITTRERHFRFVVDSSGSATIYDMEARPDNTVIIRYPDADPVIMSLEELRQIKEENRDSRGGRIIWQS